MLNWLHDGGEFRLSISGTGRGVALLHGCGPPGFPQLACSFKALRYLQSAFGASLYTCARHPPPCAGNGRRIWPARKLSSGIERDFRTIWNEPSGPH